MSVDLCTTEELLEYFDEMQCLETNPPSSCSQQRPRSNVSRQIDTRQMQIASVRGPPPHRPSHNQQLPSLPQHRHQRNYRQPINHRRDYNHQRNFNNNNDRYRQHKQQTQCAANFNDRRHNNNNNPSNTHQNDRSNPTPRRLSFYADQNQHEIIDNDAYYQVDTFEETNNNDVYNIEDNYRHIAMMNTMYNADINNEDQTVPASNINHGSEELPVPNQHDAFYNDDWEQQYNEDNFLNYEDEEQYDIADEQNFDKDY